MQDCYLAYYLTELAGATFMIFTRTCDNTRKMALMLRNLGFDAIPIHGQMAQAKRIGALNKFKAGERSILCATGGTRARCAPNIHNSKERQKWHQKNQKVGDICCIFQSFQTVERRDMLVSGCLGRAHCVQLSLSPA